MKKESKSREIKGVASLPDCPYCHQEQEASKYNLQDLNESVPSSWPKFEAWFHHWNCFNKKAHAPVCVSDLRHLKDGEPFITKRALIRYAEWMRE